MRHILLWLPLLWTIRFLLLVLTGGILYISTLYLARFLRPADARALFSGGLPALTSVGGTAKVLGQELTLSADIDKQQTGRLSVIEQRLHDLEVYVQQVLNATDRLVVKPGEPQGAP
jgi:hypothetical protein